MTAKGFGKQPDIFPLKLHREPSIYPGLTRLCLGHIETDKAAILETYYPDEIEQAERKLRSFLVRHPKLIKINDIETWSFSNMCQIERGLKVSRSTKEMTKQMVKHWQPSDLIISVGMTQTPL